MIKTALLSFIAACALVSQAKAQCYSQVTQHVNATGEWQMITGGSLCPGLYPTLTISGSPHAIALCVLAPDATVDVQVRVKSTWGTLATVGGTNAEHCYNIPAAINGLRISANGATSASVEVGVGY